MGHMKCSHYNLLLLISVLVFGCSYSVRMNQYPHLKTVSVSPIVNNSYEMLLEEDLRDNLISVFQKDGRLRIVYDNPDSIIDIEINEYETSIFGFDTQENIEEYQVRISLSVTFSDLISNEVIWENKSLIIMERYSPATAETVRFSSEEEARLEIFSNLFKTIIRNSLESW